MIVVERLKKEINALGMRPDGQVGFRNGRGTIENVYILYHLVEKNIREKRVNYTRCLWTLTQFGNIDRVLVGL